MRGYRTEFPDYPADTMPSVPDGWTDISWHNDAMPSFRVGSEEGRTLCVFVDYEDPALSEFGEFRRNGQSCRYQVAGMEDGAHPIESPLLFESDDWAMVLEFCSEGAEMWDARERLAFRQRNGLHTLEDCRTLLEEERKANKPTPDFIAWLEGEIKRLT